MENYRQIGNYYVSNCQNTSFPCQHTVIFEDKTKLSLLGDQICCILKSEGLSDPHFDKYIEFTYDMPTSREEVQISIRNIKEQEEFYRQRRKEYNKKE